MVRVGVVGFDTSHAVEFTKRINHVGISEDQWVDGARIVIGYPGEPSNFADEALISKRTQQIRDFGVEIVDSAEDIIGKVDAVMLESQEGGLHLEAAKPFLEAGLPLFIDKPFTCSVSDAEKIAETAKAHGVPVFSSSSLRYALEIQSLKTKVEKGDVLGVDVYSPAYLDPHTPGSSTMESTAWRYFTASWDLDAGLL